MNFGLLLTVYIALPALGLVSAYDAVPRWGQATAVINDALFVHGGKTDQFNTFEYSSAPNNDDLLYLPLSSPFNTSSPPWQLVSSSSNSSTSQGPALAWHTLSAFNTSEILLFGGQPGPNSPTVLVDVADSAFLLNVFRRAVPEWISEPTSWAGQPLRRIRHSTATAASGLVFIVGGEKADGSNNGVSDHYIFDPSRPSFTLLPTINAPPDISGHASIIQPNGRLLVFGGYSHSQNSLVPFSMVWAIDTTQLSPTWTMVGVSDSSLPAPRRAFAAVLLANGNILLQGGSDAILQNNFADGWILDTSKTPMVWTQVDALSQLGARRDHFAVSYGNEVIFGFGYGNASAAPAPLQIYDAVNGIFTSTFTPPPPSVTQVQTLPGPSQTSGPHSGSGAGTGTHGGVHPTATVGPDPGNPADGGGDGRPDGDGASSRTNRTTAIAVGTVFGVLGLLVLGVGAVYYVRRRRQAEGEHFMALNGGDDREDGEESPHIVGAIPAAVYPEEKRPGGHGWNFGILNSLDLAGIVNTATGARNVRRGRERRDMLADEDTRDFGEWYDARRRDGTGGSSWSLRSILGARMRSREPSTSSIFAETSHKEKADPFSDGTALIRGEETGYAAAVASTALSGKPHSQRQMSHTSTRSGTSYVDPFVDPIQEELPDRHDEVRQTQDTTLSYPRPVQPPPTLRTILPLSIDIHTLSPLSERTSQNTFSMHDLSTSVSSHTNSNEPISSFEGPSHMTSNTSLEQPRSPGPFTPSIIGASSHTSQLIRRSDSWWARFSRTSFLDRKASDASRHSTGMLDIRDPNPPPRLVAIEESTHSASQDRESPTFHGSADRGRPLSRSGSRVYGGYGKSMTSLKTAETADSEAIERMGGTMDVVQRVRTRSHRTTGSTSTTASLTVDTRPDSWKEGKPEKDSTSGFEELITFTSPVEMTKTEPLVQQHASYSPRNPPSSPFPVITSPLSSPALLTNGDRGRSSAEGAVASRIKAYERRLSQDQEVPSPTNTKHIEERTGKKSHGISVNYGLAPRPSLYVANPDHRTMVSGDS